MPKTFRHIVIAHTNDYTADKHDQIKRWVEANGGRFSKEITTEVTHLIASSRAWKRYDDIVDLLDLTRFVFDGVLTIHFMGLVKCARKEKSIHIVKFDWLEDSLSTKSRKPLDERRYSWEPKTSNKIKRLRRLQRTEKRKALAEATCQDVERDKDAPSQEVRLRRDEQIQKAGVNFDRSCKEFQKEMAKVGYHPYKDDTGFAYMVTLLRQDIHSDLLEKYQLQLYESTTQPRTYAVYLQYSKKGRRGSPDTINQELAPKGSTFEFAFDMFRKIFEKKCELRWDERPAAGNEINLDGGEDEEPEQKTLRWRPFKYLGPASGNPEGLRNQLLETQPRLGSGVPMV